ncbi:HesA/MoeB/ThiF family protein [Maricurvus nonylphenolicus]|uniref:HesA/MoeB/ThiF family protein n=1 Tax=Maricurvus nonylphenolicus TaxID=1008307 RepID=UPI0036F43787
MNDDQLLRYSRQIMLPQMDVEGQEKLLAAKVLIVGLGGLGCPVAMYLASAGVGTLVLADFDEVDLSNLQRQIAHTGDRIGHNKAESAEKMIQGLNPSINTVCITEKLTGDALQQQIAAADVVVDCTDNFTTRHAINAACVAQKTPLVSGAAIRLEGQVSVFDPRQGNTPCYRCLYEDIDDENLSCAESGVLAPLVGIIGSVQALETIKLIAEFGEPLSGRLLTLDARSMQWRELKLPRDPGCPVCGSAEKR